MLFLDVQASGSMLPFGDTVLTAILGYAVVFLGLLMLMAIVYIMGAIFLKTAPMRYTRAIRIIRPTKTTP